MLRGIRLVVNTQTPLVRFRDESGMLQGRLKLSELREPDDYKFTTGGVTRMILPLLRRWLATGKLAGAEWVALSSGEDTPILEHDGVTLSFVGLPREHKHGYAQVKEKLWAMLNSNPSTPVAHGEGGLPEAAWVAFDAYQSRAAEAIEQAVERLGGVDLLYVHDFQQLGVAQAWRGPRVPRVFHLHTPFPSVVPDGWRDYILGNLRRYDAVVVSTRRYAENLRQAGLETPLHVIPPFIDPADVPDAEPGALDELRARFGVDDRDRVILNVGRMDPIKGQDRLIRAMPELLAIVPEARLLLVGNGSFSSSRKGGLGLSKGQRWRARLERLAAELGVAHRVTFTGHLGDDLLPAAYDACEVFSLPSTREGFGLAAIEAWRHRKPIVVCDRAGVSELVVDGVNGYSVDCGDPKALAARLLDVLRDPASAQRMGKAGLAASEVSTVQEGQRELGRVFAKLLEDPRVAA